MLLPLFPLSTVLVPGLVLPLHVFEPRYRALVADLTSDGDPDAELGVVAIRQGVEVGGDSPPSTYEVGCTARLRQVTEHPDGRYDLVTTGTRRFRLLGLADTGTPYLTGRVELLEEPDGDDVDLPDLARQVGLELAAYRQAVGLAQSGLPSSPRVLSYLVAAVVVLDLADRQGLLEQPDTARRLLAERSLLRRERRLVEALGAVPAPRLTQSPASPS